jgi:maltose O-acetyltransferase
MSCLTEKEKMLEGAVYITYDHELTAARQAAKQLCFQFNHVSPMQLEERKKIIQKLLRVDHAWMEPPFHVDYGLHLHVGENFYASHGCTILDCNKITIGKDCLLYPHVCITAAFHPLEAERRVRGELLSAPITIGDNVVICANATICPGVTLGNGVVVEAGAVVTKSFGDNVVVGGVPAKIVRMFSGQQDTSKSSGC